MASLAAAVTKNFSGFYALSDNYDAAKDGTYTSSPIPGFGGTVQGLGNAISNVTMRLGKETPAEEGASYDVGFFASVTGYSASVQSLTLHNINMTVLRIGKNGVAGGLVGFNNGGQLYGDHVDGVIQSKKNAGGLVGTNVGSIMRSSAAVTISEMAPSAGLALGSGNGGTIVECFSVGMDNKGQGGLVGGLGSAGILKQSYAMAAIKGGKKPAGGAIGLVEDKSSVDTTYSTGAVKGHGLVGGFAGENDGSVTGSYWDTDTSRQQNGIGSGDSSGVTGLTTKQFKSGLPAGFDPAIWAQDKKINDGYPYLIMNPPPK